MPLFAAMPNHDPAHSPNLYTHTRTLIGLSAAALVAQLPDRVACVDRGCRLLAANSGFLALRDTTAAVIIGQPIMVIGLAPSLTTLIYRHLSRCLDQGCDMVADWSDTRTAGELRDYEVQLRPYRDAPDGVQGLVIIIRDVTALRESERRRRQLEVVYTATAEGVLITDPDGRVIAVNSAFTHITGYAESEILGQNPSLLNAHWHSRGFFISLWRRLLRNGSWQGEIWNRRKNGEIYRQRLTIRRVLDHRGRPSHFVGLFAERTAAAITDAPSLAEQLIHYDALTKLPNRLLFESRLDHALELARRKETPLALFILDLDHFSHINTSLGYQIGDDLLRTVGLKLRETIRPADTLARLRADQFALLFEEIEDLDETTSIANRLQTLMSAPIWIRGHQLHVSLSMGIAVSTGQREDRRSLMTSAETALRQVKRQGRNGFQRLTSAPHQAAHQQQQYCERLRAALNRSELQLRYRPCMNMSAESLDSVTVALYWESPELGVLTHERIIALADDSGLLPELGDWVLAQACRQLQTWFENGLAIKRLVVEISEAQFTHRDLVRTVAHHIAEYPAVATQLDLEFSEQLLVKYRTQIADVFQGLNELGLGICLGEVGIGWTAPALLQRLPIRTLKIHSSFIAALPNAHHELAVVEALIAMAQSLGLEICADGVRTKEQQYQLLSIGCLKALGELFGEAASADQCESWINPAGIRPMPIVPIEH
ncbi:PAS domain S-box-containing protein/diguanylate cyclase (GGDEF) domain-containing protein [Allochromatium warmingii]|uniref:PAS domain S-box-containing protein/diguanylate cyclase (GGDEF) domain-containing protein n=2 Tax=Allochromatium warmingii TaxID=61595 RepID=A0A1H3CQ98_ALLWA|nr:PAS domain S-box-containing protein/diguanylate cyclase (GGDEF) domain-containing protein [Allochromatium warmingii]